MDEPPKVEAISILGKWVVRNCPFVPIRRRSGRCGRKSIVTGDPGGPLRITGLYDGADRPARFEGESGRWRENLVAIARFERTLAQGAATCDPARSRCP